MNDHTHPPRHAPLHLIQAGVFVYMTITLASPWVVEPVCMGIAAVAQIGAALTLWRRRESLFHLMNALSIAAVLLVYARLGAQAVHLLRTFGEMAGDGARDALQRGGLALPWLLAWPLWQSLPWRRRTALALLALLPAVEAARPWPAWTPGWDADKAQAAALRIAERLRQTGGPWPELPDGTLVLLTPVERGAFQPSLSAHPGDLPAIASGLSLAAPQSAVLVDVVERRLPSGWVVPGRDSPDVPDPVTPARAGRTLTRRPCLPGLWSARTESALRFRSAMASAEAATPMLDGWSAPPALDEQAISTAVDHGARFLMENMSPEGRFTYIVKGPSGERTRGYNHPRHAGTSWYLARAARSTGDPAIAEAASRAIRWMADQGGTTPDGRRWVEDPKRRDGKAWIGTTALAAMAAITLPGEEELRDGWVRQVAAAVDDNGLVRGEMQTSDHSFPWDPNSAYGQGQGMLALAMAERDLGAQVPEGVAGALDRALRYLGSGDYGGDRRPQVTGDEHWMCLTAHAAAAIRPADDPGIIAAHAICESYLRSVPRGAPSITGHRPSVGGSAGVVEAMVAHAWDRQDTRWADISRAYGQLFLASQYLPADAPLLGEAQRLMGGYRTTAASLDVQIDTVQHASSALLGVLALIEGRDGPGRLP